MILALFAGTQAAHAGYLTLLLLLSPARNLPLRVRALAVVWGVAVAMVGFLIGPFGLLPILGVLVIVCLVQGVFRVSETGVMMRSPVNLVAFASMASSTVDTQLWQVATGALVGGALALGVGGLLGAPHSLPVERPAILHRLGTGLTLAIGSALIVLVAEIVHFPYPGWALLSLCMILAVDESRQEERAWNRVQGAVFGAVLATLASLLPDPIPSVIAVVCAVLCVAYLRVGQYMLFVTFLTPPILLATVSEHTPYWLAAERVGAVLAAVVIAFGCRWVATAITTGPSRRRVTE